MTTTASAGPGRCRPPARRGRRAAGPGRAPVRSAARAPPGGGRRRRPGCVRASAAYGVEHDLLGGVVEVGAGLVEEHAPADRPPAPGPARRRARWPAERPAPSSPSTRVEAVGVGADDVGQPDAAQRLPAPRRRSAPGRRAGRWRATVSATSHGRWGAQATWSCHQRGSTSARAVAADQHLARRRGRSSPRRVASRVDLPHPDGPVIATSPRAGRSTSRGAVSASVVADVRAAAASSAAACGRTAAGPAAPRPGRSRASASASAAVPSAAAWNSAPTRRSGQ